MFSHRLDFSRRFQKSTPKMANLAFVRQANWQTFVGPEETLFPRHYEKG
jgi:hypothetical protein